MFEQEIRVFRLLSVLTLPLFLGGGVLILLEHALSPVSIAVAGLLLFVWLCLFFLLRAMASALDGLDVLISQTAKQADSKLSELSRRTADIDQTLIQLHWSLSDRRKERSETAVQRWAVNADVPPVARTSRAAPQSSKQAIAFSKCRKLIREMEQLSASLEEQSERFSDDLSK